MLRWTYFRGGKVRLIRIQDYKAETMKLAKPVFDSTKRVLLAAGRTIDSSLLESIKRHRITHLMIEDEKSHGVSSDEQLEMNDWMQAIQTVEDAFASVRKQQPFPIRDLKSMVNQLIGEVQKRQTIVLIPSSSVGPELRLYAHSVNVALIGLLIGKSYGYSERQLGDLATGCLLHDIGKLTADGHKHAESGFHVLRSLREISPLSANVALQHHEKVDGSGQPRGLAGEEIHEYAQICAVAEFYENVISEKGILQHLAIEMIMALRGKMFNAKIVQTFAQVIPAYPPGTIVRLNTGEAAIVTRVNGHIQRPYIRLLSTKQEISMEANPTMMVVGITGD